MWQINVKLNPVRHYMPRELRVLHLVDHLGFGGAQRGTKAIVEHSYWSGRVEHWIYALRKAPDEIDLNHKQVLIDRSSSRYSLLPILKIIKLCRNHEIDIVHCHLFRSHVFGWLAKLFYGSKIKLILHERGHINEATLWQLSLMRLMGQKVDRYLAVSASARSALISKLSLPAALVTTLHNGIELHAFKQGALDLAQVAELKKTLGLNCSDFVIGLFGRLEPEKNIPTLIAALNEVKFNFKALIIGDGSLRNKLEGLVADLHLTDRVQFLGYQAHIIPYYQVCNIIALPSLYEAFPRCLLEAQALGIPIVATKLDSIREMLGPDSQKLLFENGDSEDLASKITQIYEHPELRIRLAEENFENVKRFDLDVYVKRLDEIYRQEIVPSTVRI